MSQIDFNYWRVMFEVAIVDGLSRVGHKCADWISDDSWVLNLLKVTTMNRDTESTGLLEYHLVELSTVNCQFNSEHRFWNVNHKFLHYFLQWIFWYYCFSWFWTIGYLLHAVFFVAWACHDMSSFPTIRYLYCLSLNGMNTCIIIIHNTLIENSSTSIL